MKKLKSLSLNSIKDVNGIYIQLRNEILNKEKLSLEEADIRAKELLVSLLQR